ncbi:MAG: hypothetical protein AAF696_34605, partial [Bacteroidota bacterium]
MIINRISKALICFLSLSFFSCETIKDIDPQDLGIIDETELLAVETSFEEIEGDTPTLDFTASEDCNRLAKVRYARREGGCQLFLQVRGRYFLNPVNIEEFEENFRNGRVVKIG